MAISWFFDDNKNLWFQWWLA